MVFAITSMKFKVMPKIKCNSRLYNKFQKEANKQRADYMKNRTVKEETREKIKNTLTGFKHSLETKQKMSLARKNKPTKWSEERKQKMKNCRTGFKHTQESKIKMSKNRLNRIKKRCEYCNGSFEIGNYTRWHGVKCKHTNNLNKKEEKRTLNNLLKRKECIHCKAIVNVGNYGRYHGDKCKSLLS